MSGNLSPLRNSSGVNFETGCSCSSSTKNKSESSRSASNMSRKTLSRRAVSNFHRCWNRKSLSRAQLVRYSGDFYCFVPKVYSVVLAVCWPPHLLGVCVCVFIRRVFVPCAGQGPSLLLGGTPPRTPGNIWSHCSHPAFLSVSWRRCSSGLEPSWPPHRFRPMLYTTDTSP